MNHEEQHSICHPVLFSQLRHQTADVAIRHPWQDHTKTLFEGSVVHSQERQDVGVMQVLPEE